MSGDERYALLAARVLQHKRLDSTPTAVSRERGIAIVSQAIAAEARRQHRRRQIWTWGMPVAAAASVLLVVGWVLGGGTLSIPGSGLGGLALGQGDSESCAAGSECGRQPLRKGQVAGSAFEPGQSVATGRGHATTVEFESGTRLSLGEGSELEYREGTAKQRFGLLRGEVKLAVAKLKLGEQLIVETRDAEVAVRGTVFRVTVVEPSAECAVPLTRVGVTEGLVEVRARGEVAWVRAGEKWHSECPPGEIKQGHSDLGPVQAVDQPVSGEVSAAVDTKAGGTSEPVRVEKRRHKSRSGKRTPGATSGRRAAVALGNRSETNFSGTEAPTAVSATAGRALGRDAREAAAKTRESSVGESSLAERKELLPLSVSLALQNELFAEAVAAGRAGRVAEALAGYEALINHYPSGPLTESALVGRMRLLAKSQSERARQEAVRYLRRFPSGFARQEAERLLDGP